MPDQDPNIADTDSRTEQFARLYSANQQSLYRYAIALVLRHDDAMDILQEASVAILRKLDTYDRNRPFLPWARRFVYLEVMRFRKRSARSAALFEPEVLDQLSEDLSSAEPLFEMRRTAMRTCLTKLTPKQRELLQLRYGEEASIKDIAEATDQSVHTLYDRLKRLRAALLECISRQVKKGGTA